MKYAKEERLVIGRQIYESESRRYQATELYGISAHTAREYMRLYHDSNQLLLRGLRIMRFRLCHARPKAVDWKIMNL